MNRPEDVDDFLVQFTIAGEESAPAAPLPNDPENSWTTTAEIPPTDEQSLQNFSAQLINAMNYSQILESTQGLPANQANLDRIQSLQHAIGVGMRNLSFMSPTVPFSVHSTGSIPEGWDDDLLLTPLVSPVITPAPSLSTTTNSNLPSPSLRADPMMGAAGVPTVDLEYLSKEAGIDIVGESSIKDVPQFPQKIVVTSDSRSTSGEPDDNDSQTGSSSRANSPIVGKKDIFQKPAVPSSRKRRQQNNSASASKRQSPAVHPVNLPAPNSVISLNSIAPTENPPINFSEIRGQPLQREMAPLTPGSLMHLPGDDVSSGTMTNQHRKLLLTSEV